MSNQLLPTEFAPAEVATPEELQDQVAKFAHLELLHRLVDRSPDIFLVLNQQRQIVFTNEVFLDTIGADDKSEVYGMRPGEAVGCVHADENEGGCGTSEFCKMCGAAQAILAGLNGNEAVRECRISVTEGNALDLRVWANPFHTSEQEEYVIFTIKDISGEKRRRALERIFFHDILNTAGGLQGIAGLLQDATAEEALELKEMVYGLAEELVDEINAQRMLTAAEEDELVLRPSRIDSLDVIRDIIHLYENHEVAREKTLRVAPDAEPVFIETDKTILKRVIGNMAKNALEASYPEGYVTLGSRLEGDEAVFWVHNSTAMSKKVQLQVFQRSFSTKGAGRGLGTYSIKLLTEQYLGGQASFTTSPEEGTTFFARYPLTLQKET